MKGMKHFTWSIGLILGLRMAGSIPAVTAADVASPNVASPSVASPGGMTVRHGPYIVNGPVWGRPGARALYGPPRPIRPSPYMYPYFGVGTGFGRDSLNWFP